MPILKIASGNYVNEEALERLIPNYVFLKSIAKGGRAIDPERAVPQMRMVKEVFGQTDGKQLHHFILIFSAWESEKIDHIDVLLDIGYHTCLYYCDQYQCVFGVHNNGKYHLHFVLNSVSYRTGQKFVHNQRDDLALADYIQSCCIPHSLKQRLGIKKIPVYYN